MKNTMHKPENLKRTKLRFDSEIHQREEATKRTFRSSEQKEEQDSRGKIFRENWEKHEIGIEQSIRERERGVADRIKSTDWLINYKQKTQRRDKLLALICASWDFLTVFWETKQSDKSNEMEKLWEQRERKWLYYIGARELDYYS